jgi:uncharacterized protein YebE (UPF0316 family)
MGFWIYPLIFFAKIAEVTINTIRIILVTKGQRIPGALLSIAEVTIWLLLASSVISNIQSDPLQIVVYVLGCAIGIFFGSLLEDRLAFGQTTIQVIADGDEGEHLAEAVRSEGFGVTIFKAQGMDDSKRVLLLHIDRKRLREARRIICDASPKAIVTVHESKTVLNGYGLKK